MHAFKVAYQVALSSNLDYPGGLNQITWVLNSREHFPAVFIGRRVWKSQRGRMLLTLKLEEGSLNVRRAFRKEQRLANVLILAR